MRLLRSSGEKGAKSGDTGASTDKALNRQVLLVPPPGAVQPSRSVHRVRHQRFFVGQVRGQRHFQNCGRECRRRGGVPLGR